MKKITVYHNPQCSKSRCAIDFLKEKNADFDVLEYLKQPLNEQQLRELIQILGIKPEALVRKNEEIYKVNFKGKVLSDDEWIKVLAEYPKLIERPIVVCNGRAVIARPTERILEVLP